MTADLIATHLSLIQFALAAVLNLPLLGSYRLASKFFPAASSFFYISASSLLVFSLFAKYFEASSLPSMLELSFVVVVAWLGFFALRYLKIPRIQVVLAPIMTFLLLLHLSLDWLRPHASSENFLANPFLACHIAGAVAGQFLAVIAAVISLVYLGQHRLLKEKRLAHVMRHLPALDLLENLLIITLGAGFLFLSVALLSGGIFLYQAPSWHHPVLVVKLIWALGVWLLYFAALFSRLIFNVSNKRLAQLSVWGFILLIGAYFGFIFHEP